VTATEGIPLRLEDSRSLPMGRPIPSPWRPFLWTFAILCLTYLPLFLGQIICFRDIAHWSFPARAFLRQSLLAGEIPGWNPYQALGFPVFADPLYGVFYPPNWLFLLVGPDQVASLVNWQSFFHMAWGGLGVCLLARRLRASTAGTAIAGIAWSLSGYVTSQWSSGLLLLANAWIPWAAVGQMALLDSLRADGKDWRRGLVKAALPGVFAWLCGEVFLAMIGAGFGILFACMVEVTERRQESSQPRARPAWLGLGLGATVLAVGVSAAVLLPARALLGSTERAASLPRDLAELCSLHPLRLIELVAPQAMGDAYTLYPAASVVGESRLDGLPLSYSVYFGASVVALALAAFGRGRRLALALGACAGFALLLALGKHTPVHGIFRRLVFPLSYMRYPEKYTGLVVPLVALLAAMGADRILSDKPQPWRRSLVLLAIVVGFGVLSGFMLPPAWKVYAVHGAFMGSIAIVVLLCVQYLAARRSRLAPLVLVALVAFDLAHAAWPLQTFGPREVATLRPPAADKVLEGRSPLAPPPRIYRSYHVSDSVNRWLPTSSNPETELKLARTLITNTANVWGIGTLPGYDAAIPPPVGDVWERGLTVGQDALRLLGAEYAILPVAGPQARARDRPGLVPVLDPLPGARLYKVPGTLPRVYWAAHAEVLSDRDALARLHEPDSVAGASVWLAPESGLPPLHQSPARAGTCSLESYASQRLVALCSGDRAGVAVLVEQFSPGWHATVDGKPVPIARANLIMRALPLAPGNHRIVLEYRIPGLPAGLAVSGTSLLVLLALFVLGARQAAPRTREHGGSSS
jgi:hypothetical protein